MIAVLWVCLQCFDTVVWVSALASGCKKLSDEVLASLFVWSEVQVISHGLADATATPPSLASLKSRVV